MARRLCFTLLSFATLSAWSASNVTRPITDVWSQETERFLNLLASPIPQRRVEALQGLAHLKHWPAEEAVLPLLHDPALDVRRATVQTLGRIGTAKSVPHLIRFLDESVWDIRQEAWLTLRRLTAQDFPAAPKAAWQEWWDAGSDIAREQALLEATRGTAEPTNSLAPPRRREALRALRHLASPAAEPALLRLLTSPPPPPLSLEERILVAETLERVGSAQAVPVLAGQHTDAAAWALARIGGPEALGALAGFRPSLGMLLALDRLQFTNAGPFVPLLVDQMGLITYRSQPDDVMNTDDQPIQRVAANLIRRSGQAPLLVELVLQELEDSMQPPLAHGPRPVAPAEWGPMLAQMRDELKPGFVRNDGRTTSQPLTALSHLVDEPALSGRLIALLRHPAFVARVYVAFALGRLRSGEAVPEIVRIIREGYSFSDATALASGKHFDQSQTVRWRGFLCLALGRLGGEDARLALEMLAVDAAQPRDVRYCSVVGLQFIGSPQSGPVLRRVADQDIIWMVRLTAQEVADEIDLLQPEPKP